MKGELPDVVWVIAPAHMRGRMIVHDAPPAIIDGPVAKYTRATPPADERDLTAYEADALGSAMRASMKKVEHPRDAAVRELVEAIDRLPVEQWVEEGPYGEPELIGYVMQAQGEWDDIRRLKDRVQAQLEGK